MVYSTLAVFCMVPAFFILGLGAALGAGAGRLRSLRPEDVSRSPYTALARIKIQLSY